MYNAQNIPYDSYPTQNVHSVEAEKPQCGRISSFYHYGYNCTFPNEDN